MFEALATKSYIPTTTTTSANTTEAEGASTGQQQPPVASIPPETASIEAANKDASLDSKIKSSHREVDNNYCVVCIKKIESVLRDFLYNYDECKFNATLVI